MDPLISGDKQIVKEYAFGTMMLERFQEIAINDGSQHNVKLQNLSNFSSVNVKHLAGIDENYLSVTGTDFYDPYKL